MSIEKDKKANAYIKGFTDCWYNKPYNNIYANDDYIEREYYDGGWYNAQNTKNDILGEE